MAAFLLFMIRPQSPPASPSSPLLHLSLPASFSLPKTLSTNKAADLLIWGLCGCCLEDCAHVCLGRGQGGGEREIYLSEHTRIGESEGGRMERKRRLKGEMQNEIYGGVRMEHIKKEVKDLKSVEQVSNTGRNV